MLIQGAGIVFAGGRGMDRLKAVLQNRRIPPSSDGEGTCHRVDLASVGDKQIFRSLRRADRFSKLSVLAAWDAVLDSGDDLAQKDRVGIILASAFGPHVSTFTLLDDLIQYGDEGVSPTLFSHSVHNAAVFYIAKVLGIRGPAQTVTQFHFSLHQALILAQAWLDEGRCSHVLVGSTDELGSVMEYISGTMVGHAKDGTIRPFSFAPQTDAVPGEGSVFFLVTKETGKGEYCAMKVLFNRVGERPDLTVVDTDSLLTDESCYLASVSPQIPVAAYSPIFGSMMTLSAFNSAAAALMLREGVCFNNPVTDNPHGIRLATDGIDEPLKRIQVIKYDCNGAMAAIELTREGD